MKFFDALKIIVSIGILSLLFYKAGPEKIISSFTSMNLVYLPIVVGLFVIGLLMGAYNIKLLTDALGVKITFGEMWNYYLKSWAIGLIVPGKVGEFSFIYLVKKHMNAGQATAVSIVDKLITVISLCAIAFIGFFVFFDFGTALKLALLSSVAVVVGIVFVFTKAGRGLIKKILGKHKEIFSGFSKSVMFLVVEEKKAVLLNLIITFLKWGVTSVATYCAFLAFGASVNLLTILAVSATGMLLSLIPITVSGLGIKEGAAVYLYGLSGVPAAIAISVQIILLMMNYAGAALVFVLKK